MRMWGAVVVTAAAIVLVMLWADAADCLVEQYSTPSCAYAPAVGFPAAVAYSAAITTLLVVAATVALRRQPRAPKPG